LAAHLTAKARWCDGVVPAIGVVAHGGPTAWCACVAAAAFAFGATGTGSRTHVRDVPTWFLFKDGGEVAIVVAAVA